MEQTMLNRFCMGQQLRALLSTNFMPPGAASLLVDFDRIFKTNVCGTLFNDILAFSDPEEQTENVDWKESDLNPLSKDECLLLHTWLLAHTCDYNAKKGIRPY